MKLVIERTGKDLYVMLEEGSHHRLACRIRRDDGVRRMSAADLGRECDAFKVAGGEDWYAVFELAAPKKRKRAKR